MARIYCLNPALSVNELRDAVKERLQKIQALIHLSQAEDFLDFSAETIGNYLWLQNDLLNETWEIFEVYSQSLGNLQDSLQLSRSEA